MGLFSMTMGFWLDNGFQLGKAFRDARRFKENDKHLVENLRAYQENIGERFAVIESTSMIFGEYISSVEVYMKDCVWSVTLFEEDTPMLIEMETLGERREHDFYFGNTIKDMLIGVTASEKLEADAVPEKVKQLLTTLKDRYRLKLTQAQLEEAVLKIKTELNLRQSRQV